MKYYTKDENEFDWVKNPDGYEAGETIRRIQDAGKWDEFIALHANEDGEVDMDSLYDYLRFESDEALQDVGLHETQGTATVAEVAAAWDEANAPARIRRDENGKPLASMYTFRGETTLDFDTIDEDGEEDGVSLDPCEVAELMRDKHNGNANTGEWDSEDPETAEIEFYCERR